MQGVLTRIAESDRKYFGRVSTKLKMMAAIERFVLRRMTYVGTRTQFDTSFVQSVNPDVRTYHGPEAVNPSFLKLKPRLRDRNILFVGSLIARKDVVTLVDAFADVKREFQSAKLRLVGDGDAQYIAQIRQAIRINNLEDSVELLGHQQASRIANLLEESSVLVLPSLIENSPNVILEAMAAGVPVVATRVGGVPSLIEDGQTGILIEPRDSRGLASAIIRLWRTPSLSAAVSRAAKRQAQAQNHPSVVADRMMDIYRDIIDKQSSE
jgi:glycosyltransferase involved in cell wall biosynthesis